MTGRPRRFGLQAGGLAGLAGLAQKRQTLAAAHEPVGLSVSPVRHQVTTLTHSLALLLLLFTFASQLSLPPSPIRSALLFHPCQKGKTSLESPPPRPSPLSKITGDPQTTTDVPARSSKPTNHPVAIATDAHLQRIKESLYQRATKHQRILL